LRAKFGLTSDYQVAKLLGMKRQQISSYRMGRHTFDDQIATKVAQLLEVPPAYIMACMAAQRAKTPEMRKTWERAAKVLAAAAVLITAGCTLLLGSDAGAFDITQCFALFLGYLPVPTIHYAQSVIASGLFFAWVCAWTLAKRRTCSARSR
jgi:transcriptional regulator with XRE-family HTH domain